MATNLAVIGLELFVEVGKRGREKHEVNGLVLLAPTLWVNGWNVPWTMKLFKLVVCKWFANMIKCPDSSPHGIKDERIRRFFADALFSGDQSGAGLPYTPGGAVLEHRRLSRHVRSRLAEIDQPTLILHPRDDDLADIDNSWFLQRKLRGCVELVALEDSYHNVTLDRQRHTVVERTSAFVGQIVRRIADKSKKAGRLAIAN